MAKLPLRGKRGKPRKASEVSEVKTVRIDPRSERLLKAEFGNLSNALFYIAEGLRTFRGRKGLASLESGEGFILGKDQTRYLEKVEIETLMEALDAFIRTEMDGRKIRRLSRLLNKLIYYVEM